MPAAGQIIVRPTRWGIIDINGSKFIECYGYTSDGDTIYFRLPSNTTQIVEGNMTPESFININKQYNILHMRQARDGKLLIRTDNIDAKSVTEMYGPLPSLWATIDIGPYEWLALKNYTPLPGKYTNCDLNIITDESCIEALPDDDELTVNLKLFFVDYRVNEQCVHLTIMNGTQVQSCLISWADNTTLKHQIIGAQSQQHALAKLFGMYSHLQPDLLIYFGRETITMLQQYLAQYKPRLSRIVNPVTNDTNLTTIDLQQYLVKFHNTISHKTLEELLITTNSSTLSELCLHFETIDILTVVANNLSITFDDILIGNDAIDKAIFNIDAAATMISDKQHTVAMNHLKSNMSLDVNDYVYDYSELYQQLMMTSKDDLVTTLAVRLEHAPSSLIKDAFFSKYVNDKALIYQLRSQLNQLDNVNAITATHVYSSHPLTANWLKLVSN